MDTEKAQIFGIGYSGLDMPDFLGILVEHGISIVVDIRTFAMSRHKPDFSKNNLAGWLGAVGVDYAHEGKSLGGKRPPVGFEKRIDQLAMMAKRGERVCLLCVESTASACHRTSVLKPALAKRNVELLELTRCE